LTASRLIVSHITTYRYSEPVEFGEHRMMFRPRESHDLRIIRTQLEIAPRPSGLHWLHDVFDNSVAVATFEDPSATLRFKSTMTLEQTEATSPDYMLAPHARTYPFAYSDDDELPNLAEAMRRRHAGPEVDSWIRQFLPIVGPADTMDLLRRITLGLRNHFDYERRTEKGVQSPRETLARERGSCRDFALLMMEGARALGLAARFVSGYIYMPATGETASGGATHAWLQIYLPGAGWVDFDPTNSIVGNRNLIRVAVTPDPSQALPLWRSFFGRPSSFLGMDVTVRVSDGQKPRAD
jgi:transglutaminase-like putative cysteine protease